MWEEHSHHISLSLRKVYLFYMADKVIVESGLEGEDEEGSTSEQSMKREKTRVSARLLESRWSRVRLGGRKRRAKKT